MVKKYITKKNIYTVDFETLNNDCAAYEKKYNRSPILILNNKSALALIYCGINQEYPYTMQLATLTSFNGY